MPASTGIDQYQPDIDGYCPTSTRYRLLLMAIHQISEVPPAKVIDLHRPILTWSMLVDVGPYQSILDDIGRYQSISVDIGQ